ncbi:MAG: SufD family Fe-S cluster assembly protein [Bacilli bacterium]|nr:SufD family Fe-S cluster assembly protein [Bacilli bacterium]MDD4608327.1 SufD family Fe-S cluster assembly protein [Bacilli bacterium]
MNKIRIVNDIPEIVSLNDSIEFTVLEKNELFSVNSLKIRVKKSTSLEIEYQSIETTKLDIFINVEENVKFNLFEFREGNNNKIQYKYYLEENSKSNITKFYNVSNIKEMIIVNLNGKKAEFNYNFKTISVSEEKYDMIVYHNYSNTISNIKNNGVNILDGVLTFNVSGFILNNKKDCVLNQNNRIINLTNNKCQITPNLFIDDNNVDANHSALIGKFSDEEIFYLQRLGIDETIATNLLIKGFLLSDIKKSKQSKIIKIIDQYWR